MYRIGQSNDIHNLIEQKTNIWLGGEVFSSNYNIVAHSDGDIILHALSDSIYGALSLGDLGDHFKDDSIENKDISSKIFLYDSLKKMKELNFEISNVDMTIISEHLFISNWKKKIVKSLQSLTKCKNINIKATRWEENKMMIQCNCVILLKLV